MRTWPAIFMVHRVAEESLRRDQKRKSKYRKYLMFFALAFSLMLVLHDMASALPTYLSIKNIEATQAVQCLDQSVGYTKCPDNALELDTNRPVAVRVYIDHDDPCNIMDNAEIPIPGLSATVKIDYFAFHTQGNFVPIHAEKQFDAPCTNNLSKLRDAAQGSATFIIPPENLGFPNKKNFLWIRAEVVPPAGVAANTNSIKIVQMGGKDAQGNDLPGGLVPRNPLSVGWMYVYYNPCPSKKYTPYTGPPLACDINSYCDIYDYGGFMNDLYPGGVNYYPSPSYLVYGIYNKADGNIYCAPDLRDDDSGELLSQLAAAGQIPQFWCPYLPGTPCPSVALPRAVMGWVPKGAHNGAPYIGMGGGAGAGESEPDDNAPETLAHEIGHVLDFNHPGDPDQPEQCYPFDVPYDGVWNLADVREAGFRMSQQTPTSAHNSDFMKQGTSVGGTGISPYFWGVMGTEAEGTWTDAEKRYSAYWAKEGPGCAQDPPSTSTGSQSSAIPQPALLVRGHTLPDGSLILAPLYQISSTGTLPVSDPSGSYCLDLLSSSGSLLASHCFNLSYVVASNGAGSRTGTFAFAMLLPAGSQTAILRQGTKELVVRTASPHVPNLLITKPQGGEEFSGPMAVAWTASDPDGDELASMLLYSWDGGVTFFPLAFDLKGTEFDVDIDTRLLAGSDTAMIRIATTDGFNTVVADSPLFKVAQKAPVAHIQAPADGTAINSRDDVVLTGHATDLEDGELTGQSLSWTSSINGSLGSGSQLVLPPQRLSPGVHKISLTAQDSSGLTVTASITLTIFQQIYIDVEPWIKPNIIDLKLNCLPIPVAILSTPTFNAPKSVKWDSLTFGHTGKEKSLEFCSPISIDVNGDKIPDFTCFFNTGEAAFKCGDTQGILKGKTKDGTPIQGRDLVRIIPCK